MTSSSPDYKIIRCYPNSVLNVDWMGNWPTAFISEYIDKMVMYIQNNCADELNGYEIYSGLGGIIYMFIRLDKDLPSGIFKLYLKCLKAKRHKRMSFLCGQVGGYALLSRIDKKFVKKIWEFKPNYNYPEESVELLYGASGWIYALQYILMYVPNLDNSTRNNLESEIKVCREYIWKCGTTKGLSNIRTYWWHDSPYLGAAHGTVGIMFILLEDEEWAKQNEHDIIANIEYLLTQKVFPSGNLATREDSALDEPRSDRLVQWCHGSPGLVMLLCRACEIFTNPKYKFLTTAAIEHGEVVWKYGILKKGPGLCHGILGNAYCFLTLYRYGLGDYWLDRAWKFALFALGIEKELPKNIDADVINDSLPSFWNSPDQPLSLMNGMAGAVCFLKDLIEITNNQRMKGMPCFEL